jgi:hypothetical protein
VPFFDPEQIIETLIALAIIDGAEAANIYREPGGHFPCSFPHKCNNSKQCEPTAALDAIKVAEAFDDVKLNLILAATAIAAAAAPLVATAIVLAMERPLAPDG